MHTGDLGALDVDGYLTITGRKKDLIINASGKNISPQEIETRLRYEPLISQAVVIGDGRPYLTALLTLDSEAVLEWAAHHGRSGTIEALTSRPRRAPTRSARASTGSTSSTPASRASSGGTCSPTTSPSPAAS